MAEPSATATNPTSCYWTQSTYGAPGYYRPIVMPTAAALTPKLFQYAPRPPPLPQPKVAPTMRPSCSGYFTLDECPNAHPTGTHQKPAHPHVKYEWQGY
jgi:hypothetical protein